MSPRITVNFRERQRGGFCAARCRANGTAGRFWRYRLEPVACPSPASGARSWCRAAESGHGHPFVPVAARPQRLPPITTSTDHGRKCSYTRSRGYLVAMAGTVPLQSSVPEQTGKSLGLGHALNGNKGDRVSSCLVPSRGGIRPHAGAGPLSLRRTGWSGDHDVADPAPPPHHPNRTQARDQLRLGSQRTANPVVRRRRGSGDWPVLGVRIQAKER
jgi:hypothetical protein